MPWRVIAVLQDGSSLSLVFRRADAPRSLDALKLMLEALDATAAPALVSVTVVHEREEA